MIELNRDSLKLEKAYSPRYRTVVLFGILKISFRKKYSKDFLHWETEGGHTLGGKVVPGFYIHHKGRLTWHSVKKTLETHLNRVDNPVLKAVIKKTFKD